LINFSPTSVKRTRTP